MKFSVKLGLLIWLGMLTTLGFATDFGPARSELERFANDLDRFHAEFTQTVKSQDGRVQDKTQGEIWLQTPDKLRWEYTGEFPEVIVADGKNIWVYDESLQQVTVKPQSGQAANSPLMIMGDVSKIDEQFHIVELGDVEGLQLLELKSIALESEFERILLGLDSSGIRMMVMEDAFGQRTEVHFENMLVNPPIEAQLFSFTPPEGVDVVGITALSE